MTSYRLNLAERLLVLLAAPLIHLLGLTLRFELKGRVDLGFPKGKSGSFLMTLWHETLLMGMWFHRGMNVHVLISQSRDGELIAGVTRRFGYIPERGSSTRGGVLGARGMVSALKGGERGAITPDGPRGPRRKLHEGVLAIAKLSGRPILPVAFCAQRCWRVGSWDRFIIPKPFSRAVFVYGEPIGVPRKGDDAKSLRMIQAAMDRAMEQAESHFPGSRIRR